MAGTMRTKTYLTPDRQWFETICHVDAVMKKHGWDQIIDYPCFIGMIVRSHRLFLVKDLVFYRLSNGMASRMPVTAVSSKGYRITEFMMRYDFDGPNGQLQPVQLPDHLGGRQLDDPDVARFVETLRVGEPHPGRRV